MPPELVQLGRLIVGIGLLIAVIGLVLVGLGTISPGDALGRFRAPGDIFIRRGNFAFYFPIGTCILISVVLTLLFRFFSR